MLAGLYDQPQKMTRSFLSVLITLLLVGSSFVSTSSTKKYFLKRKFIEIKTESDSDLMENGDTTSASITPSSSTVSQVPSMTVTTKTKKYPSNPWNISDKFDLDPQSLPQRKENLHVYRTLFVALGTGDFETTCLLLTLFDDLKMTRYFQELKNGHFLTFYHLAFVKFSIEEFKTIASFCDESDLVYPSCRGSTIFDLALSAKDERKISFLRNIFIKHNEKMSELKELVIHNGITSLFVKHEL